MNFGRGSHAPEYMNSVAMLKPRKQNEAGNDIGCSCERRKLFTAVVLSTQRIAASDSNPFIQRAILFDLKECRSRRSSPRRFSHLVVWEIPAPEIENVFFNPRSQTLSWLRVHEKCAHRSQNLVSSSPPVPFLFKSIFPPDFLASARVE